MDDTSKTNTDQYLYIEQ